MQNRPTFKAVVAAATLSLGLFAPLQTVAAKTHAAVAAPAPTAQLSAPQMFVKGSASLFNPDGIVITKRFVFVVWQNLSDHMPGDSYIVKYDHTGKTLGTVGLVGRCDGLRLNPYTNLIWASVNNDGLNGHPKRQPYLATIDPRSLATKLYAFPAVQPHGGGYDDIAFVNGQAFLSAASPTLTSTGLNPNPIAVKAVLTADGKVDITPILSGTATVYDVNAGANDKMNFSDPDSLAVDNYNDLVVIGDNDQEAVIIVNPGTSKQTVKRYGFATQFDDIAYSQGTSGTLWVADGATNSIYTIAATFPAGTIFSETGTGNPVNSFIGTIDGANALTPILTQRDGIFDPTSLEFVPAGGPTDGI